MDGKEGKWEAHQSSASLMDDMPCDENFFSVFVQQSPEEKNNIVDHFSSTKTVESLRAILRTQFLH